MDSLAVAVDVQMCNVKRVLWMYVARTALREDDMLTPIALGAVVVVVAAQRAPSGDTAVHSHCAVHVLPSPAVPQPLLWQGGGAAPERR